MVCSCLIHNGKQKHDFKIYISLVLCNCLELQFLRLVLNGYPPVNRFNNRYFHIQARAKQPPVFTKNSYYRYIPLLHLYKT